MMTFKEHYMRKKQEKCIDCMRQLTKDEIALNRKMISLELKEFRCLDCLSVSFGCEVEDLQIKIEEFKEQGCNLFI